MGARPARPARFLRSQHLFAAFVPAAVVVLSITGFVWAQKSVTVIVDGDTRQLTTQATDVAGALRDAHVAVSAPDVVTPSESSELSDGATIVVRRAIPVTLRVSGESIRLSVVGRTVADALVAAGVDPSKNLSVTPPLTTPLSAGLHIVAPKTVVRVIEKQVSLAYKTRTHSDPSLERGKREIVAKGKNGRAVRVYRVLVTDGVEGARVLISQRVLAKPVDKVVAMGSATKRAASKRARAASVARAAGRTAAGKRMTVTATAYAPGSDGVDWRTATGGRAGLGVVAVDPDVIPLGTRLYIPGYGYGIASDTGGAIKGSRIDLCFENRAEAMIWGRRSVSVVILK